MRPAVTADEVASGAKARGAMTPDDEADEEALDGWTVSASPGDGGAGELLEKNEPTLLVPSCGGRMVAESSGSERRAASEAGRNPAKEELEAAAPDMAAAARSGGGGGAMEGAAAGLGFCGSVDRN